MLQWVVRNRFELRASLPPDSRFTSPHDGILAYISASLKSRVMPYTMCSGKRGSLSDDYDISGTSF